MGLVSTAPHAIGSAATLDLYSDDGPSTSEPTPPAWVGRYEVRERLGEGAMGVVYRGYDPLLDRSVAIKLIHSRRASAESRLRMLGEARALAHLHHPNVIRVFDVGSSGGNLFVAMQLVENGTLRHWLLHSAPSFDAIVDAFVDAGRGLAATHAAGLVHRDFKPDNVLIGADGGIYVADFGLARFTSSPARRAEPAVLVPGTQTQAGVVVGTPAYMAPEQLRGAAIDARADQFSFCVALWEGIYGERPFRAPRRDADTDQALREQLAVIAAGPRRPLRTDRPAWIAPLLIRGLADDRDQRWPSLQALLDAIAARRARRAWPRRIATGLAAIATAIAIAAVMHPAPPPPVPQIDTLTIPLGTTEVAISPLGDRVALASRHAIAIRRLDRTAEERIVSDDIVAGRMSWSPDGRRLLVTTQPIIGRIVTEVLDIDGGARFALPAQGIASFLSSTEVAIAQFHPRIVEIYPAAPRGAALARCEVPGDYTVIWNLLGLPDEMIAVDVLRHDLSHAVVILGRDCLVRGSFFAEPLTSVALSDTATVVGLGIGNGSREIVEIALDGKVVSRRPVGGELGQLHGRRRGVDYASKLTTQTHLVRVHGSGPPSRSLSIRETASFAFAPDGNRVAWIEPSGPIEQHPPGLLRIARLDELAHPASVLLGNALMVGWSPDGQRLAVLVKREQGDDPAVIIVDPSGAKPQQLLHLPPLDSEAAPVWLDDHRVAAASRDRSSYYWVDLDTGEQREIGDRAHGSIYWLARSPVDGTLAMWWMGPRGAVDERSEHLWIQPVAQPPRAIHVAEAVSHYLLPSWTPSGDLVVRALDTGVVSRVDLDSGALTQIARLPATSTHRNYDDHVLVLPDGDVIGVEIAIEVNLLAVRPGDAALDPR